jgi:hypothetical protein
MLDYLIKKSYIVWTDNKVFLIWLFLVIVWNFGFPNVPPIADVIVAVLLTFTSNYLKKMRGKK